MRTSFFPSKDVELLLWSKLFSEKINLQPEVYGISPERAAAYAATHAEFAEAMKGVEPGIRNKSSVSRKNAVREVLKEQARSLVFVIKGQGIPDEQLIELGLTVPKQRSSIPAPTERPCVAIKSVDGPIVRLELRRLEGRSKPPGVQSAQVYCFLGDSFPADPSKWTLKAMTSRTRLAVQFAEVAPGAKVWFCAPWLNPRTQEGPMSNPICTHIQGGIPAIQNKVLARAA